MKPTTIAGWVNPCGNHTPLPTGYLARQEAFVELLKTHVQKVCPDCGRWAVWVEKPAPRPAEVQP